MGKLRTITVMRRLPLCYEFCFEVAWPIILGKMGVTERLERDLTITRFHLVYLTENPKFLSEIARSIFKNIWGKQAGVKEMLDTDLTIVRFQISNLDSLKICLNLHRNEAAPVTS